MADARSHVIDNGKTRVVVVVEGSRTVIHATKYGEKESTLVTASMHIHEANKLGLWLIANTRNGV